MTCSLNYEFPTRNSTERYIFSYNSFAAQLLVMVYKMGEPLPFDAFQGASDQGVLDFTKSGFDYLLFVENIRIRDVISFLKGPITYGLFERENVPFVTIEFPFMIFDSPLNILKVRPDIAERWLEVSPQSCLLVLVDATTRIVNGLRVIPLDKEFETSLKEILRNQQVHYRDMQEVDQCTAALFEKYSSKMMLALSKRFRVAGHEPPRLGPKL